RLTPAGVRSAVPASRRPRGSVGLEDKSFRGEHVLALEGRFERVVPQARLDRRDARRIDAIVDDERAQEIAPTDDAGGGVGLRAAASARGIECRDLDAKRRLREGPSDRRGGRASEGPVEEGSGRGNPSLGGVTGEQGPSTRSGAVLA